jgi:glycosyltransferase involved in cell wall biosynthesis
MFVQAYRILPEDMEEAIYGAPCPKVCTSTFLRRMAIELGTAPAHAVHVPYGLRHDKYRVTVPIDRRPPRVSMLYNNHPAKCAALGVEALAVARQRFPDLEVVLFGTNPPDDEVPADMTFVVSPDQDVLVREIYNTSRVFVSSALYEGFGLAPVEAMACGAALVTTDNGGADDYAVDGVTALVAPPLDVDALATRIIELLDDDGRRQEIAESGRSFVERFTWDVAAERLERFLMDHLVPGAPARSGRSAP